MKRFKNLTFYVATIGGFVILMYWVILKGRQMEVGRDILKQQGSGSPWQDFLITLLDNLQHPLAILLAQIFIIILVARLFGWAFKKIGQPSVIGEIIAGIVLGPSFLGLYFPELSASLFPLESFDNLQFLSQIGLILFMYVVGMELDLSVLKDKADDAVVISHASIVFPFALGVGLAYFIYQSFAPVGVEFLSFALFIGISMSITAFPVLARIVQERNLQKTKLGSMVITCAAADDITAWCLLAAVIAIVKAGSFLSAIYIIALAVAYVIIMLKIVRPFLKRIGEMHDSRENLSKPIVAIFFVILIISSYLTEVIGIHALFGAFMAGVIMPVNNKFRNIFIDKVEDVAVVLLLPLFFVFTGLRTEIGLLNEPYLWKVTIFIILVAVAGKFLGSAFAARFVGQSWKDSLSIGALMNTRGLMELVVLNIGFDLGVLTPEVFAMMVIMALLTTFMTGPSLDLIERMFKKKELLIPSDLRTMGGFNILISFGDPDKGRNLLRLAHSMVKKQQNNSTITAMHLTPTNDLNHYNAEQYEIDSFEPIVGESKAIDQKLTTLFKASSNIQGDVVEIANEGTYDLLLIGVGQSIYEGTILGRIFGFTTRIINPEKMIYRIKNKENLLDDPIFSDIALEIVHKVKINVGVFIDKGLFEADKILVPILTEADLNLLKYVQKLIQNSNAQVIILDQHGLINRNKTNLEWIRAIEHIAPNHIAKFENQEMTKEFLDEQNLMILSLESWKKVLREKNTWLSDIPSTLIILEKE